MAGEPYRRDEEEEDADEEMDEADYKTQKDALIFAIEVSESMLEAPPESDSKKPDTDSAVSAALKCACQIMQQRIISSPKDVMGILFFGTKKSKFREEVAYAGGAMYPNCYLYMDLDIPAAIDVQALRNLGDGEDPEEILEASTEPAKLSNLLFCANTVFTTNSPNFGSRRLFIITDNDSPHGGDKAARTSAAVRAKDLYDLGVNIELFPISREGKTFDRTKFYDDVVYRDPDAEENSLGANTESKSGDGLTLLSSLISNINSKQTPKRAYFSNLSFQIAPELIISVNGYITLHRQKPARTTYIYTEGEVSKLATGETRKFANDAGPAETELDKREDKFKIKKAYKFGGDYVYFTPEETKILKNWDMGRVFKGKGLRIIGFKPRSMLPIWASVKRSMFIYPSEVDYVGSYRVFSALWQKLLADKKMAIAWFMPRSNSTPLLVAILPTGPRDGDDASTPFLPAGLWLVPLPFADDIRTFEKKETKQCSSALIDQMRTVVNNLQLPKGIYNPMKYPNPQLQWHYKILQALALEDAVPDQEEHEDLTKPKYKTIAKRVGGYIADVNEAVEEEAQKLLTERAIKRDADESDDEKPPKKKARTAPAAKKAAGGGGGMNGTQLKMAVDQGTLGKMTVPELKDVLTIRNLPTSGKKADLLERVEQWVEENT